MSRDGVAVWAGKNILRNLPAAKSVEYYIITKRNGFIFRQAGQMYQSSKVVEI